MRSVLGAHHVVPLQAPNNCSRHQKVALDDFNRPITQWYGQKALVLGAQPLLDGGFEGGVGLEGAWVDRAACQGARLVARCKPLRDGAAVIGVCGGQCHGVSHELAADGAQECVGGRGG